MKVGFEMEKGELEIMLAAFKEAEAATLGTLNRIRANINAIEGALSPVRHVVVTSEHDMFRTYTVTRTEVNPGAYVYECSCPSYQYQRGLDPDGYCKHIRKARLEGRWL